MSEQLRIIAVALALAVLVIAPSSPAAAAQQHVHDHQAEAKAPSDLPPFIPPVTDEDRAAAFPDVEDHPTHGEGIHSFVLVDRLEWRGGDDDSLALDIDGWIGGDRDRAWLRLEGERADGSVGEARAHALYGRQIARWWDVVAGVRQDARAGPAQTWAAVGIQGLAPYWFDIQATAYLGAEGRTQLRFEVEYDLLLTRRLVLQPVLDVELNGKSDAERGIVAGLSRTEGGFRLRYEIRREFAPYAGVIWENAQGDRRDDGGRLVTGLRVWF